MDFDYQPDKPCAYEGWLLKANVKLFERWQRRYFRIQGRCMFYFKKETIGEPTAGFIPLIDIEIKENTNKKVKGAGFSIHLQKNPTFAKKHDYSLAADTEEQRKLWIQKISENQAYSIVGESYMVATEISPRGKDEHNLLPYFVPPILHVLNTSAYKLRNIWTVEVPSEIISKGLATLNCNYMIGTDDIHNAVATFVAYLNALPEGLLPGDDMGKFASKVTINDLKELVRKAPAPVRHLLRELAMHFQKVLENTSTNNVTVYSLLPVLGPFLIRPPSGSSLVPSQIKTIQDNVAQTLLTNAQKIFDDVHQLLDATRLPLIRRARVIQNTNES